MPVVRCRHCNGGGSCSCGSCRVYLPNGQYTGGVCKGCGGDGKINVADGATTCPHCHGVGSCSCGSCRVYLPNGQYTGGVCKACSGAGVA